MEKNTVPPETSVIDRITTTIERFRPYLVRLWIGRKKFLIANAVFAVLASIYLVLFAKPTFESTVDILPEFGTKSLSGDLGGLAAVAGLVGSIQNATEIYEELVYSEAVLEPVIYAKYQTEEYPDSVDLITYFDLKSKPSLLSYIGIKRKSDLTLERQERYDFIKMYKDLKRSYLTTGYDRFTKILSITVDAPEAKLSADIVNNIAESLDDYVRTKRKSYASTQRFYIEKRVGQVMDSLSIVEEQLEHFQEENRVVLQSPQLLMDQARLSRNLEMLQSVYAELTNQLELVKIEEIKDTPIVNIKELARDPILQVSRTKKMKLIIVIFFSILLSSLFFIFQPELNKNIDKIWLSVKRIS